ncbi:hypothetical protein BOTBODRAFT_159657 [Botryobasidium botryosum FD-172 SS1]|uniref:EKC/KEOPS complex subunit CGI121 n=1 Tax=Botryobasidium botryosum (strain FD-172 SS1) TaxID=930990 RepID=A0A067MQF0_BOTB1|nr:hypothetical protein BOTBODRAFT_159657 [Botryobasidium botryosum FD-172 SS1]
MPVLLEHLWYANVRTDLQTVYIALFANVANAAAIRNRIVAAASLRGEEGERERNEINFAFLDARPITSRLHISTAIYQALVAADQGSLRTKTVHSEILWTLNPSNNISESIKRFGISSTSTSLLVVHVCSPVNAGGPAPAEVAQRLRFIIRGDMVDLDAGLERVTDWDLVKKYYKLQTDPVISALSAKPDRSNREKERELVNELVVSAVAMKCVMS